jgi:hypothetical protein
MKRIFTLNLLSFFFFIVSSQVPQGFNYQAIARDVTGNAISNASLPVRITIQSDSLGGTPFWVEEFSSITTNNFGMFTLVIGKGVRQAVSSVGTFDAIDWRVTPKFIKTEINYNGWKNMGSSRLWSVPYAQVSGSLAGSIKKLAVKGEVVPMDSALFEVKNSTGQTVFAVYNEGVRVYVDDGIAKGATKGGFAIGGFGTVKAPSQEYFRVTRDSTRVYVNPAVVKGATKGGFAIGGFGTVKGSDNNYLDLTPLNYFIGLGAGKSVTTGVYNSFIGYQNGYSTSTGSQNVFLGYQSGYSNTDGSSNVNIGYQVAYYNSSGGRNVVLGKEAGLGLLSGTNYSDNVFMGYRSGYSNNAGWSNVFAGTESGYFNGSGYNNVFIGYRNGYNNTSGNNNTFIGTESGYSNTFGYYNVFMGNLSGRSNTSGNQNVMIGHQAGKASVDGNYNVFIGQSAAEISASGDGNVCLGMFSGNQMNGASWNTYLGAYTGMWNSTGGSNVAVGTSAGYYNTTGSQNTYIGGAAGAIHSSGNKNVYLGNQTGYNQVTGTSNLFLGAEAGYNSTTVSGNIFVGYQAGYSETNSNRLYIENSSADKNSALIYGEFDTKNLTINGNVGIGKTSPLTKLDIVGGNWNVTGASEGDFRIGNGTYRLKIGVATAGGGAGDVRINAMGGTNRIILGGNGIDVLVVNSSNIVPATDNTITLGGSGNRWTTVYAANGTINTSDARLKTNIQEIGYGLETILKLRPVSFSWKDDSNNLLRLGLIAQEVQNVMSEVVDKGSDPAQTLGINYSEFVPVLIKGMQEQQTQIESVKQENIQLKSVNESLVEKIKSLESRMEQVESLLPKTGGK